MFLGNVLAKSPYNEWQMCNLAKDVSRKLTKHSIIDRSTSKKLTRTMIVNKHNRTTGQCSPSIRFLKCQYSGQMLAACQNGAEVLGKREDWVTPVSVYRVLYLSNLPLLQRRCRCCDLARGCLQLLGSQPYHMLWCSIRQTRWSGMAGRCASSSFPGSHSCSFRLALLLKWLCSLFNPLLLQHAVGSSDSIRARVSNTLWAWSCNSSKWR